MKVFVTGANGMLGSSFVPRLKERGHEFLLTDRRAQDELVSLDIRDADAAQELIEDFQPDVVAHLAAETNVDRCEEDPDHAFQTNAVGTANVAKACKRADAVMLYISTGSVFDGEKAPPYTEADPPNPLNVYAKSKLEGEHIVRQSVERSFITRAGWMIGGVERDKKFVAKIVQQLKDGKRELLAVNDKVGSPTFTGDMGAALVRLLDLDSYGTYHLANHGWASRYDIACKIVEFWGDPDVEVVPVGSDRFPLPAPRGASEALEDRRLIDMGYGDWMRPWEVALEEYINTMRSYAG